MTMSIAQLRNDLLRKGLITPLPTCQCGRQIALEFWDSHRAQCPAAKQSEAEKPTPR